MLDRLPAMPGWMDSGIWFQTQRVVTPFHYDATYGLLFQLRGEKRVLFYPPAQGYNALAPYSALSAGGCHASMIGTDAALESREREFLGSATDAPYELMLRPGETLYIPPFWWHHVEVLSPSISYSVRTAMRGAKLLHPLNVRTVVDALLGRLRGALPSSM